VGTTTPVPAVTVTVHGAVDVRGDTLAEASVDEPTVKPPISATEAAATTMNEEERERNVRPTLLLFLSVLIKFNPSVICVLHNALQRNETNLLSDFFNDKSFEPLEQPKLPCETNPPSCYEPDQSVLETKSFVDPTSLRNDQSNDAERFFIVHLLHSLQFNKSRDFVALTSIPCVLAAAFTTSLLAHQLASLTTG
jgi:hypothetical protein